MKQANGYVLHRFCYITTEFHARLVNSICPSRWRPQNCPNQPTASFQITHLMSVFSENFTDENIIQFKVSGQSGQHLLVQSANLVIRVKCKQNPVKEQRSSSGERKKRKRKHRTVTLVIYSVEADGKPGKQLASTKSKLRKTKWLRMNLPKDVVQKAVDSNERKLQVYVKCVGCDKKTRLILAQKGRKRHQQSARKLHKRRPILYLHSQIQSQTRRRRSTEALECSRNNNTECICHKKLSEIDLINEFGWDWILYPTRYKTCVCLYTCSNNSISTSYPDSVRDFLESEHRTRHSCTPVVHPTPMTVLYYDNDGEIRVSRLRNMIVTDCECVT